MKAFCENVVKTVVKRRMRCIVKIVSDYMQIITIMTFLACDTTFLKKSYVHDFIIEIGI